MAAIMALWRSSSRVFRPPTSACTTSLQNQPSRHFAGHSHYANIKHKKARNDQLRAPVLSKHAQALKRAIRQGGSADPDENPELKSAIADAKRDNVSKDVIEKALKGGSQVSTCTFDVKGKGGVGFVIEVEAVGSGAQNQVKFELQRLAKKQDLISLESVQHMFHRKGVIYFPMSTGNEDVFLEACIEHGGDDVVQNEQKKIFQIVCDPLEFQKILGRYEQSELGDKIEHAAIEFLPKEEMLVPLSSTDPHWKLLPLLTNLQEASVNTIFHNMIQESEE